MSTWLLRINRSAVDSERLRSSQHSIDSLGDIFNISLVNVAIYTDGTYMPDIIVRDQHDDARRGRELTKFGRVGGVRQLLLHHISRRYNPKQVEDEARAIFPNALVVSDFDQFTVSRAEG